jgi:hypothetical protein
MALSIIKARNDAIAGFFLDRIILKMGHIDAELSVVQLLQSQLSDHWMI